MARDLVLHIVADPSQLTKGLKTADRQVKSFGREMSKLTRGTLAGTGAFHSFGRTLAYASGGFIAAHTASSFLRESADAARDAAVSQRALAAQMKASGESFTRNQDEIEKASRSYAKFGFENDEVVKSMTVLERATGSITDAISMQQGVADIARGKNLDLASAALVVGKALSGQETALRRAVPGLSKTAHGADLVQAAFKKMAGQAAANTTTAERFHATLHDTEEIIGTALLPTLNKYLDSVGKWLTKMNESGDLQRSVASAAEAVSTAFDTLKGIFDALNKVTGSTKETLKDLLDVFILLKARAMLIEWGVITSGITGIGTAAEGAATEVGLLDTMLLRLKNMGPVAVAVALNFVPKSPAGQGGTEGFRNTKIGQILSGVPVLGGLNSWILTTGDRINKALGIKGPTQGLAGPAGAPLPGLFGPGQLQRFLPPLRFPRYPYTGPPIPNPATAAQRNQWFDTRIARELDRVQDLGLRKQLARLKYIAQEVKDRIAQTKDVTRRNTLEDKYVQILREEKSVQSQITDQMKQQNQALKDRADAIKSAVLDRLQRQQTDTENKRALKDATDQLKLMQALGGPKGIEQARRNVHDVNFQIRYARLQQAPATLTSGGQFAYGGVVINIHGVTDPEAVANKVVAVLRRRGRHTSQQQRGAASAAGGGPH